MAPKKNPKVTSSSTRSARVKGGSNPVVTKGEARTRAARTSLGPAPKQRPMATGGTKGPLQSGTRSPGLKMNASKMEAGPAKVGPSLGQQSTSSSAGPRSMRPPSESRIRSMEAGPGKVRAGMGGGTTLSSKPGANAAGAQAAKDAARMSNRTAKGYGQPGKVEGGLRQLAKSKIGKGGAAVLGLQVVSAIQDRFLSPEQLTNKRAFQNYSAMDAAAPLLKKLSGGNKTAKSAASTSRFAGARDKAIAKAKGIKGSPVLGPKKVGTGKVGTIAQAFDRSSAAARKAGKSTFMFRGKKYTTEMA